MAGVRLSAVFVFFAAFVFAAGVFVLVFAAVLILVPVFVPAVAAVAVLCARAVFAAVFVFQNTHLLPLVCAADFLLCIFKRKKGREGIASFATMAKRR